MFKIGEFSQLAQVSTRMLRHYDKLGLLKPGEIDHFTGYRYYTLDQLPRLNRIIALKDLGFSLEQIAGMLTENVSAEQMRGMLLIKQAEIQRRLDEEQQRLARVAARLRQIEREGQPSPYEVVLKQPETHVIASIRQIVPQLSDMPDYRCVMFEDVHTWLARCRVKPSAPEIVIYHAPEFIEENIDMETAVPIPPETWKELGRLTSGGIQIRKLDDSSEFAATIHKGSIYDIPQAMTALFAWVGGSGYEVAGSLREVHLSGRETSNTDFEDITFEFQLPVAKSSFPA